MKKQIFMLGLLIGLQLSGAEITAEKVKDFADPAWEKIPVQKLSKEGTFRIAYSDKAILLKMKATPGKFDAAPVPHDSAKLWNNRVWEIYLADGTCRRIFAFNAVKKSGYEAAIYANNSRSVRWSTAWEHQDSVSNGSWESNVTIPFAGISRRFSPGMRLSVQVALNAQATDKAVWCWNPSASKAEDLTGYNGVTFGTAPAVREAEVNSGFDKKDAKGKLLNWSTKKLKMEVIDGSKGKALKVSGDVPSYDAAYNNALVFVNPGEELTITAQVRGKGRINLGVHWQSNAGSWVVNGSGKTIQLTEKPVELKEVFTPEKAGKQGVSCLKFTFYLQRPGGELIIDSLKVEIRKK